MSQYRQLALEAQRGGLGDLGRALLMLERAGISLDEIGNILIENPQTGQVLEYDATLGKWKNADPPEGGPGGDFQPLNATLTALGAMVTTAGIVFQVDADTFSKLQIGTTAGTVAAGDHNHDGVYATAAHLHDATYSPIAHNHDSAYISVIATPTAGNFPVMNSGGELETSAYLPTSFVSTGLAITALSSVVVNGTLSTSLTFTLRNDSISPGNNMVYGTDASGVKGWKADPVGGGGTYQPLDATLTALAGLNFSTGVVYQTGEDSFEKRLIGSTAGTIAAGDHTHADLTPTARQIATQYSLTGGGDLTANRTLNLVGDVASPGVDKVYATDASGVRTWRDGIFSTTIPTGLSSVSNIVALRAVASPADGAAVFVRYHTATDDLGGGLFHFDASLTQTRMVNSVTISSGGSGYSANTLLTVSGGTTVGSRPARALITAVSGGAVTTVLLIDKGNYSVDPTTSGAATTCVAGTGCALNLTMAKFDNDGTRIAPTSVATGMWVRNADTKVMNVRWFGARGAFSGDDRQKIQNAINAAGSAGVISLNVGRYIVPNTLYLEDGQTLKGENSGGIGSQVTFSNTAVPGIKVNDLPASGAKSRVTIRDMMISGNGGPYSIVLYAVTEALIENINFTSAVTADNILLSNCWGSRINLCKFYGASNSHIHLARPSGHLGNHAIVIEKIYTSSGAQYGILIDSETGAVSGIGIHINDCAVQGANTAQVAILSADGVSINGLYTEDGPRPIILGDKANSRSAGNVHISGCTFMTYGSSTPMLLSFCANAVIEGCNLNVNGNQTQWLHYDDVQNVTIIGCSPNDFHSGVRRTATATRGLTIHKGESASEAASITLLSSGATEHQHFKMSVNGSGAWVATEWIPTSL